MANSIALAQKFTPIIDEIYKAAAKTLVLDTQTKLDYSGTNEIKVLKVSTTGLGDYDRSTGYPKGDVTAAWETLKLAEERAKAISVDRMDDEETLGLAFGNVTGKFMKEWVVPELDAYRFAKYAGTSGISTTAGAALTSSTILAAIDEAVKQFDADEVPQENRKLFISSDLMPVMNAALARSWGNESSISRTVLEYNNMQIIYVPKTRFYTAITLNTGTGGSWGYSKATDGKDINFMLISPDAVVQVEKMVLPKIFTPDDNQTTDSWLFQFRLYHDCFVYANKVKGIYLHKVL